jgi:hypothetical protein
MELVRYGKGTVFCFTESTPVLTAFVFTLNLQITNPFYLRKHVQVMKLDGGNFVT